MATRKKADDWFVEYGESHQHHTNELIHWVCVPIIFWCVLGLVSVIPVPAEWKLALPWFDWSFVAMGTALLFYLRLSPALTAGMLCFMALCSALITVLELFSPWPVWRIFLVIFVVAWIGQFVGHKIEGKRPSFF